MEENILNLRFRFPVRQNIINRNNCSTTVGLAGLCVLDVEGLRLHYARTLDFWIANFGKNVDRIRQMFDEKFVRMWRLYLNVSSAAFKFSGNRIYQILFTNSLNIKLPITKETASTGRSAWLSGGNQVKNNHR